jgi:hypothetical protein
MTGDTTNASALPGAASSTPVGPGFAARARQVAHRLVRVVVDVWTFLRFLVFVVYLLIAVIVFWLWAITAAIGMIRLLCRALMLLLLSLSGSRVPRPPVPTAPSTSLAVKRELVALWDLRLEAYEELARPLARHLIGARRATRTFWHWSPSRKAFTLMVTGWLVVVPGLYVVPRSHDVQITDDNAVAYDKKTSKTTYLVHALDLHAANTTREYLNEDAWYLGKINSQGLKSQLQIGRTYRLRVVGIRWYYMPTLYPNIISATEIDADGNPVERPGRLVAPR